MTKGARWSLSQRSSYGIRPSAAVPSFGVCPEPSPIESADMTKAAWCSDHDCLAKKRWPAWADQPATNERFGSSQYLVYERHEQRCK